MQGTSCPECLRAGVSGVGRVTGKGWARAGTRAGLGFLAWRSGVAVFRVGRESRVGRAERRCGAVVAALTSWWGCVGARGCAQPFGCCSCRCGLGGALLELAEVGDGFG